MTRLQITALVTVLVTAVLVVGYLDKPPTPEEQVFNACTKARAEYNQFSENYCGALQDEYGLQWNCNREQSKCWVDKESNLYPEGDK